MNQSARANTSPAASSETHTETTYFLAIDDPTEQKIAAAWLKATYPNTKGRMTVTLPLNRLSEKAIVIPIIRGDDRTSLNERRRTMNGQHEYDVHRPDDLIREVRECKAVRCADHWRGKTDDWDAFGGTLIRDAFISDLAISSSPLCAKTHVGNPDTLKLSWI